jgi:hypothetical protein
MHQIKKLRWSGKFKSPFSKFLAPVTSIWVAFWIFSDRAQLLDPESAASKEPRSGLLRELWSIEALGEIKRKPVFYRGRLLVGKRKS